MALPSVADEFPRPSRMREYFQFVNVQSNYIPNIFCLSPQLMRMQTGAEIVRRNVIEMKTKKLLKFCCVF